MKHCCCVALLCCFSFLSAQTIATPTIDVAALDNEHTHLQELLTHIVKADGVDYQSLRSQHTTSLQYYRKQLATAIKHDEKDEQLAFYINAYNALTLALVNELLPQDHSQWAGWSVTHIHKFWKNYTFEVHGEWMTLDHIEHKILRHMGEPRIHFALNCASRSCPPLLNNAYTGKRIDKQLQTQMLHFMNSEQHVRINDKHLEVNPLLKWFGSDFKSTGGVAAWLVKYTNNEDVRTYLENKQALHFFDYDWSLNSSTAE